ncbi:hypothetical protein ACHAXT_013245 [Thalassiosira profunda]
MADPVLGLDESDRWMDGALARASGSGPSPLGDDPFGDGFGALPPPAAMSPSPSPAPPKKRRRLAKSTKIDHTYRDFGRLPVSEVTRLCQSESSAATATVVSAETAEALRGAAAPPAGATGKKAASFPRKLYEILTTPEYQDVICFMPHGRSWILLDKERLVSEVLPKHFNHNKFESFNRQVNGWGFKRLLSRGPDHKSYYHECFLRGRPELAALMTRLVNPGKRLPDKDGEPDFYALSPLPELEGLSASNLSASNHSSLSTAGSLKGSMAEEPKLPRMTGKGVEMRSAFEAGPAPLPLGSLQSGCQQHPLGQLALPAHQLVQPLGPGDLNLLGGLPQQVASSHAHAMLPFFGASNPMPAAPWPPVGGNPLPHTLLPSQQQALSMLMGGAAPAPLVSTGASHPAAAVLAYEVHASRGNADAWNIPLAGASSLHSGPASSSLAPHHSLTSSSDQSKEVMPQDRGDGTETAEGALSSAHRAELSNIREPDPLLDSFAEIYFANQHNLCTDEFT